VILSNTAIRQAVEDGRLIIDPLPANFYSNTSSIDLRLDNVLVIPEENPSVSIKPGAGGLAQYLSKNSSTHDLKTQGPFTLPKGELILGQTLERIHLVSHADPTKPHLAARVEGKSSYARCGILVHFTAPTIHAGFPGKITLELMRLGPLEVPLEAGIPICQLIVEEVQGIPKDAPSQFDGQSHPAGR